MTRLKMATWGLLLSGIVLSLGSQPASATQAPGYNDPFQAIFLLLFVGVPAIAVGSGISGVLLRRHRRRGFGLLPPKRSRKLLDMDHHGREWQEVRTRTVHRHLVTGTLLAPVWAMAGVMVIGPAPPNAPFAVLPDILLWSVLWTVGTVALLMLVEPSPDRELVEESLVTFGIYFGSLGLVAQLLVVSIVMEPDLPFGLLSVYVSVTVAGVGMLLVGRATAARVSW